MLMGDDMRKLLLILPLIFCGCATTDLGSSTTSSVRNSKCEKGIHSFKVFQVIEDRVLASVCESNDRLCIGHTVIIPVDTRDGIHFNDQIINIKSGQCPVFTGTYKYENREGLERTVPTATIIDSHWQSKLTTDLATKVLKNYFTAENLQEKFLEFCELRLVDSGKFDDKAYICTMTPSKDEEMMFMVTDSPFIKGQLTYEHNSNKNTYFIMLSFQKKNDKEIDVAIFDAEKQSVLMRRSEQFTETVN